jgi:Protein O-mannosyl-transferase TMEM260-like
MSEPLLRRLPSAVFCFVAALVLYLFTLSEGVHWGDHAELQLATAAPTFGVGIRSYPLWVSLSAVLVRVFPLDPAVGANVLSAIFGALAVALSFLYVSGAFGSRRAGFFTAATLAVSHLLWSSSTVAEVYSLAACFVFLMLMAAEDSLGSTRRGAFLLGLITGLGLLHHRMLQLVAVSLLFVLPVLWFNRQSLRRGLLFGLLGTVLGTIPTACLLLAGPTPATFAARVQVFLGGGLVAHLPEGLGAGTGLLGLLLYELRFLAFNLPGPQGLGLLLALKQRAVPWPGHRAPLFAILIGNLPAVIFFPHVGDRYVLMLPAISAGAALAGVAVATRRVRTPVQWALPVLALLCPPIFYGILATTDLPDRLHLFRGASRVHREEFIWPGHARDRSASRFAEEVLAAVPENGIVLSGWGDGQVLLYAQRIRGLRPDVKIYSNAASNRIEAILRRHPAQMICVTAYPLTDRRMQHPEGYELVELIPGVLWFLTREVVK